MENFQSLSKFLSITFFQMNSTLSTESAVTETKNNDCNIFIQALNEIDANQIEEKVQENIDTDNSPKLKIVFPNHTKKSTMESYLTRGLGSGKPGFEPPGKASSERCPL